ncbi:MAG: twin-arginine translocase TatA/TatE family subunit [Helicobacteraceae bacterium]|nr:twin-arginine translocase TatA/TatE family subunit [Helicobacteraceae bacterium]
MGIPSMPELIVILAIVLLLFGAKKIPDLAKGLGGGIKNFKNAIKEDDETENKTIEANKEAGKTTTNDMEKVA